MLLGILMLQSMETKKNATDGSNSAHSMWLCSSVSLAGCECCSSLSVFNC